ncbi:MAG: tRNA uridine-5-carboxymethylaminomethyl(34) synthesis GTPase MnmE [Lachnospiraceae bacterium]|nr:tRNA uridine-5-carboxymethylaminomethyl(34) synthesis GTPase MnmE [Lachnospiraceae bacterium]
MKSFDTIAAIATGMTNSGIGIVRISGLDAFSIIDKIYRSKSGTKKLSMSNSHTVHYGYIYDGEELVDEVMVLVMKGPNTYTRENTIEIDCHGGYYVTKKILETVLKNGARAAEPGEFTKRAFLNGRIDLSQAEAVIDIINSKNEFALKASLKQLGGNISDKIKKLRNDILYQIAFIESALDDPEHISLDNYVDELLPLVENFKSELVGILKNADNGKVLTEGIKTVIVGKPNVGKSSLLNLLLGEEKAIVTDVAGTTRDILEERVHLDGLDLLLVDTAGIRDTEDIVEQIGVERAKNNLIDADLIIYVADASVPLNDNDYEIIEMIKDRKAIVLLNKTDLEVVISKEELEARTGKTVVSISAKEREGIEDFTSILKDMFLSGEINYNDEIYITNLRHKEAIREALESIEMVHKSIKDGMPEDFFTIDMMNAYEQLGNIIGESVNDDLVNEIFSKFCMGK